MVYINIEYILLVQRLTKNKSRINKIESCWAETEFDVKQKLTLPYRLEHIFYTIVSHFLLIASVLE